MPKKSPLIPIIAILLSTFVDPRYAQAAMILDIDVTHPGITPEFAQGGNFGNSNPNTQTRRYSVIATAINWEDERVYYLVRNQMSPPTNRDLPEYRIEVRDFAVETRSRAWRRIEGQTSILLPHQSGDGRYIELPERTMIYFPHLKWLLVCLDGWELVVIDFSSGNQFKLSLREDWIKEALLELRPDIFRALFEAEGRSRADIFSRWTLSPSGQFLASAIYNHGFFQKWIVIWDTTSLRPIRSFSINMMATNSLNIKFQGEYGLKICSNHKCAHVENFLLEVFNRDQSNEMNIRYADASASDMSRENSLNDREWESTNSKIQFLNEYTYLFEPRLIVKSRNPECAEYLQPRGTRFLPLYSNREKLLKVNSRPHMFEAVYEEPRGNRLAVLTSHPVHSTDVSYRFRLFRHER